MRGSISKRANKKTVIIASVVGVLLVALVTFFIVQSMNKKEDPYKQTETINEAPSGNDTAPTPTDQTDTSEPTGQTPPASKPDEDTPQLDPATVATIDITPLELTVSYVKGVGGFEYLVQRTANGTRFVEFRNEELAGTKCTGDTGPFASILVNPAADESATLAKKVTRDGTVYGLSLAAANCTSNEELLKKYQASFSDAFGLLKRTGSN